MRREIAARRRTRRVIGNSDDTDDSHLSVGLRTDDISVTLKVTQAVACEVCSGCLGGVHVLKVLYAFFSTNINKRETVLIFLFVLFFQFSFLV